MLPAHPVVSIGMPVFNGERYIKDALDSLLSQSFTDFELIISDNSSTDKTGEICRHYSGRDARIRYIRQEDNIGGVANFQFVLNEAVGDYFMWAAHDDYWRPDFISHALTAMIDKTAGFVFPTTVVKSIHFGVFKKIPQELFRGFENIDRGIRILSFANLHQYSYKCNMVYSLFRRSILKEACSVQDISNEFLLCMLILDKTRGVVMKDYNYFKRYPYRWPGVRKRFSVKARKRIQFEKWRDETSGKAKDLFPEISATLEQIRLEHEPANYHSGYKIVKNLLVGDSVLR